VSWFSMSNAPPTWELLLVPDGMKKISMEMDSKIPNAATFLVLKEDHTMGNILRMQLLENPKVLFAGYKMPHPLEHQFVLKIQTTPDTTPLDVLKYELNNMINLISGMMLNFEVFSF
jgi:DNA-directed RNA polymerase II subunit RPB11